MEFNIKAIRKEDNKELNIFYNVFGLDEENAINCIREREFKGDKGIIFKSELVTGTERELNKQINLLITIDECMYDSEQIREFISMFNTLTENLDMDCWTLVLDNEDRKKIINENSGEPK